MIDYAEEMKQMKNKIAEMEKQLTFQKGTKVESDQDGNRGASEETTGNVNYSKFNDNEEKGESPDEDINYEDASNDPEMKAKKKLLISKMKMMEA